MTKKNEKQQGVSGEVEHIYVVRYRAERSHWKILAVCKTEELALEVVRKHKRTLAKCLSYKFSNDSVYHSIKEHLLASDLGAAFAPAAMGYDVIWENKDGVYESPIHEKRKERRGGENNHRTQ